MADIKNIYKEIARAMSWSYKFKDHTADIAVDVEADNLSELYIGAAYAWHESITDTKIDGVLERKSVTLNEENIEILLVSILSELNFLFQTENWLLSSVKQIELNKKNDIWNLSVILLGSKFIRGELKLKTEIKAVTYHQMDIQEKKGKYSTRIVFDI
jgi:SHS2 domain-containing protein